MKLYVKLEWRKGGKSTVWYTDKEPSSEYMSVGSTPPRLMAEAEVGEFQSILNRKVEQDYGAGRRHQYRVYEAVELVYPYAIVKSHHIAVRERFPDSHFRAVNLLNGSESTLDKHAICHEIIRAARTKKLKGSFDLDMRP